MEENYDLNNRKAGPIGIFDSGYGGLSVLAEIHALMPNYEYIYLGDNARAPYGNRSFERVHQFTLEAVKWFFNQGCNLVVLACNTASAKALRTIQQIDLPKLDPNKRVLGVIRPTVESVPLLTKNGHVGIMGTEGTILSGSYELEIGKLYPQVTVTSEACPMWVPLVENREYDKPGADYFVQQHLERLFEKDPQIDTLILGCTHYPMLLQKIAKYLPKNMKVVSQGKYVAESLRNYLLRHPEMEKTCSKNRSLRYYTTDSPDKFGLQASIFLQEHVKALQTDLQ